MCVLMPGGFDMKNKILMIVGIAVAGAMVLTAAVNTGSKGVGLDEG